MNDNINTLQTRINELESSISETRDEFLIRINELKLELTALRKISQTESINQQQKVNYKAANSITNGPVSNSVKIKETTSPTPSQPDSDLSIEASSKQQVQEPEYKQSAPPSPPGYVSKFCSNLFKATFVFILSRLSIFITPFQELYSRLIKLYYHYQEQGKAPVFLMTVAGIFTLTIGFGYLLQYSFNTLFNDTLKAVSGFAIGTGIISAGVLLAIKKRHFRDYAAGIIALGVIFNYLTAYFIGPYYGIVTEPFGFMLLLASRLLLFRSQLYLKLG